MPFSDVARRVGEVRDRIAAAAARGGHGQEVTLVAVTKTHGPEAVEAVWRAGVHDVAENKVQEAVAKMEGVAVPVRWHLVGHLQRNKVRFLEHFAMLHSLDSARLADTVSEFGVRHGRAVEALLQVNVTGEETKGGFGPDEVRGEAERMASLPGLRLRGVMTMAPYGADERVLRAAFSGARHAGEVLREAGHPADVLSMGMSDDFEIAVEEGATHVRLGTILFGARD